MRFVALIATLGLLAAPALAGVPTLDLTGTWFGEFKCTEYSGEGRVKFFEPAELQISQSGDLLQIDWIGEGGYDGIAINDPKKPDQRGTVSLVECDTDFDQSAGYAEMSLLSAKIDRERGRGAMKGEGVYNLNGNFIGECKWKFVLVDTSDPGASGCFGE